MNSTRSRAGGLADRRDRALLGRKLWPGRVSNRAFRVADPAVTAVLQLLLLMLRRRRLLLLLLLLLLLVLLLLLLYYCCFCCCCCFHHHHHHPKPSTPNPKQKKHPKSQILNPQPSTRNTEQVGTNTLNPETPVFLN